MGVGDPPDLRFAFEHGIDMTDCVLPTRNARHGTVWLTGDRTVHLTNQTFQADRRPIEPGCQCLSCHFGYSRGFFCAINSKPKIRLPVVWPPSTTCFI